MDDIVFVFRKKDSRFHSIEKVFKGVMSNIPENIKTNSIDLPFFSSSFVSIIRNVLFLRRQPGRVIHVTGDVHYAVLGAKGRPTILTIHDCNFLNNYSGLKKRLLKLLFLDLPLKYADVITTISEKSREEIVKASGCSRERIRVIPNAVPGEVYRSNLRPLSGTVRCLFIGTTPNKNLPRTIEAIRGMDVELHILGSPDDETATLMYQAGIPVVTHFALTDKQVADLYANCDVVLYPSLYEGFGMPVIEGQKAGRPVLTSDIEPMRSISGGAAVFVDPLSVQSIREGLLRIIDDESFRKSLVEEGFRNSGQFDLNLIASKYTDIYNEILA